MLFLIRIVSIAANLLTLLIIVQVILSYFMPPYHPVRAVIDRIVEPMLAPIRRILPTFAGLDFSPFVLLILIQIIESVLINLLRSLA